MPIDQKALLRLGSRDLPGETAVADWQATLGRLGYPPGPGDGIFGARTERATRALQQAAGVDVDGVVGPATRAAAERLGHRDVKPENLLHGIDVAAWQNEIDWPRVAASGRKFCWIKATEGSSLVDARFAANWAGARAAGLMTGGYAFMTISSTAEAQARWFLQHLPPGATLPPMIDVERGINGGTPRAAAVLAFARVLEEGLRARGERYVRPVVYCSPGTAIAFLQGSPALGDYPLVVAHYGVEAPTVPPPWKYWSGWQTGTGRVDGIAGDVDLDVIRPEAIQIG